MASTPTAIPPGFLWLMLIFGGAIIIEQVTGLKCPICNNCFQKFGTNGRIDWTKVPLKECPQNYTHCLFSLDSWHPNGTEGQPSDVWAACSKQDMDISLSDCLNELENGEVGYEGAVDKHGEKKIQDMLACAGDLWGEGGVAPVTGGESNPAKGTFRTVCVCGVDGCIGKDGKKHVFRPLKCPFCENCYRKYPNKGLGKIDWGKVPLKACPPGHNFCSFWIPDWAEKDPAPEGEPAYATCSKSKVNLKDCLKRVGVPLKAEDRDCFDIHLQVVGHEKFDKAQDCLGEPFWPHIPGPAAKLEAGPQGRQGAEHGKRDAIKSLCQCQEDNCTAKLGDRYTVWRPRPGQGPGPTPGPTPTPGPGTREKASTTPAPPPRVFPDGWYPKDYKHGILVPFPYKSSSANTIRISYSVGLSASLTFMAYLLLPAIVN